MSALEEQLKAYQDAPLVLDCVWFHTGEKWVAAIDKTETGDFSQASLLAEYEKGFQYASFGKESMLNYTVNVYDEGQTLSIVTTSGGSFTFSKFFKNFKN